MRVVVLNVSLPGPSAGSGAFLIEAYCGEVCGQSSVLLSNVESLAAVYLLKLFERHIRSTLEVQPLLQVCR